MDGNFRYQKLVEKIRAEGFPRDEAKKRKLFIELDDWHELFFHSDQEKAAAIRVGREVFQAQYPLGALYFAFCLFKDHPKAYSEFRHLVEQELITGRLLDQERRENQLRLERERIRAQECAQELANRTKEFTLEEFYNKVWSTPAKTLAAELGISDVMIGKICRKHKIPKPSLGYWAKFYAGKKVRQPSFPDALANSSVKITIVRR